MICSKLVRPKGDLKAFDQRQFHRNLKTTMMKCTFSALFPVPRHSLSLQCSQYFYPMIFHCCKLQLKFLVLSVFLNQYTIIICVIYRAPELKKSLFMTQSVEYWLMTDEACQNMTKSNCICICIVLTGGLQGIEDWLKFKTHKKCY